MKISYTNSYNHYFQFNLYHLAHQRTQQFSLLLLVGFVAYLFWFYFQIPDVGLLINWIVFVILEFVIVLIYIGTIIVYLLFSISTSKNVAVLTSHEITLVDNSLIEETPFNKSEHSWSGIYKVIQNRSFIFIYATEHGAYFIPKKAFESADKVKEFYNYACKCWESKRII